MILNPNSVLHHLPDRDAPGYEAAFEAEEQCRTRGAAMRTGRYIQGTGIDLDDAR